MTRFQSRLRLARPSRRIGAVTAVVVTALVGTSMYAWATSSSAPSSLVTITPCRAVDTRNAGPALGAGTHRDFSMVAASFTSQGGNAAGCGVPSSATGISITLTEVDTVGAGYLAAFPAGSAWAGNSTVNWSASGQATADSTSIQTGTSPSSGVGSITVQAGGGSGAASDVIVDITGYYVPSPSGSGGTTYTAGQGLTLSNNQFSVNSGQLLPASTGCADGSLAAASSSAGHWVCVPSPLPRSWQLAGLPGTNGWTTLSNTSWTSVTDTTTTLPPGTYSVTGSGQLDVPPGLDVSCSIDLDGSLIGPQPNVDQGTQGGEILGAVSYRVTVAPGAAGQLSIACEGDPNAPAGATAPEARDWNAVATAVSAAN